MSSRGILTSLENAVKNRDYQQPATSFQKTMNKNKKSRKRWLWVVGVIALIIVVVGVVLPGRVRSSIAETAPQESQITTAFIGNLSANATASGRVVAQRDARLALNSSGPVTAVHVTAGDIVQAGDLLVQLETAALQRAVTSAEQDLAIQEANLSSLLAPANAADVASAQALLANAQANLNRTLAGPTDEEIASAEANVRAAQADVASASARLNSALPTGNDEAIQAAQIQVQLAQQTATQAAEQHSTVLVTEPNQFLSEDRLATMEESARAAALQANANLASAQESLDQLLNGNPNSIAAAQAGVAAAAAQRDAAQGQLDLLMEPATDAEIAAVQASVVQAQANLDRLQRGAADWQVTQVEVQVEQARISLQRAQQDLANSTLTAPFDGLITAVYVSEGESASGVLLEMVDSASLEVVLDVDEVDIGEIALGQTAEITFEAWPNEALASEVIAIAPQATQTSGSALVTYEVSLALGQSDLPVRVGMTANATLVTAVRDNVLLVPNGAINTDRSSNKITVFRVTTDAQGVEVVEEVPVTVGLRDSRYTQITGGLQEGDQVTIGYSPPANQFGPGGGGPFQGGSNGNDGGPFGG